MIWGVIDRVNVFGMAAQTLPPFPQAPNPCEGGLAACDALIP
jgi:hypothetical protein